MSIQFPDELRRSLAILPSKYFLTPTFFSALMFHQLLQKQIHFVNAEDVQNNPDFSFHLYATDGYDSHVFKPTEPSQYYIVHFPGNGQNGLDLEYMQQHLKAAPQANHVFFNYPAINRYELDQCGPEKWFEAGYQHVKGLIRDDHLEAQTQHIVLAGWSMGCGVAAHVAQRLYREGFHVGLLMDRGFLSTKALLQEQLNEKLAQHRLATIATASINMGLLGVSIFCIFARSMATIGLLAGSLVAGIGYALGKGFEAIACHLNTSIALPLYFCGIILNNCFGALGSTLNIVINLIASLIEFLGIVGLVLGAITGALLGSLFSVNQFFGFKPIILPIVSFDLFAAITGLRLDTEQVLTDLVDTTAYQEGGNKITAINTTNDWLVPNNASISYALESNKCFKSNDKIKTVWFAEGDHGNTLGTPIAPAPAETTFASVLQDMIQPNF
ncbi:MAG: hypothetical protein EBY16_03790 [Gammaproteobacteria bacterium]|nr:hypothetical protein [Gammaproteobacteria bacterium]